MNPADRARAVFADNAAPNACAADLLCDRHKAAPPRFTFVEPDLSARNLTYAQ
jgi:acetyl-CoA synthetase